jgi:hypothetical protein
LSILLRSRKGLPQPLSAVDDVAFPRSPCRVLKIIIWTDIHLASSYVNE